MGGHLRPTHIAHSSSTVESLIVKFTRRKLVNMVYNHSVKILLYFACMCSAGRATERSKISLWVLRPQPKPSRHFLLTSNLGYKTDDSGASGGYEGGQ